MNEILTKRIKTSYGELLLGSFDGKICLCDWVHRSMRNRIDTRIQDGLKAVYKEGTSPILEILEQQLDEYFEKKRTEFEIPLLTVGTDFQKTVWRTLSGVLYGQKRTYSNLADMAGEPRAIRATGSANGANAIAILIPCHRIIGKNGLLGGYAGGQNTKRKLLELESQPLLNWRDQTFSSCQAHSTSRKILVKQPNSHMCFGCGLKNQFGLKARFFELEGKELVGIFSPVDEHQGYPGRLHGGIASTILDETVGRAMLIDHKKSWWVTAELSVRFRKPIPIDGPVRVLGRILRNRGRIFEGSGEILLSDGTVAVTAEARYFAQPIEDIVENADFADEIWEVIPESTDPLSIEIQ